MANPSSFLLFLAIIFVLGFETHQFPVSGQGSCGRRSSVAENAVKSRRGKRIVGGAHAYPGKWPWMTALFFNNTQYCGGSIINDKWIVTTAHCFHDNCSSKDAKDWLVKVGKFNMKIKEPEEQSFEVKRIIIHPNYTSMWDTYHVDKPDDNDIALLELDQPIKYTNYVQPVCLQEGVKFSPGQVCTVAGWGHTKHNGKTQDKLRDVEIKLVSRKNCNLPRSYNGSVHDRAICAGYEKGGRDACQYDSGGPLLCWKGNHWYLVGQVSWGEKCAVPYKYGVYTNMEKVTPWVMKTMATLRQNSMFGQANQSVYNGS